MNVGELLIRIGADTRGVREGVRDTRREIDSLPDEHVIRIRIEEDGGGGGASSSLRRNKNLLQAFISLLPIAAAGVQVTAGALGGLVSMLGAATAGASGFAAVAVATLNDVFDAQKNITKANEDLAKASTEVERAAATKKLAEAYKGLNTYQLAALGSLQRFKGFWDEFVSSFQAPVVVAFSEALDGLRYILTNIAPAIRATANSILLIFQRMREAAKSSEDFRNFFDWLGGAAGRSVTTFGMMFMNIMQGVMNLMVAFSPVSDSMQGGFRGMTEAFLKWTQGLKDSQGFKDFISFVISAGPTFLMTIKQLVVLFMDLVHALSPLGKIMLDIINIVVGLFNVLTAFVLGLGNLKNRVNDVMNSIRSLFGFQKKESASLTDSLIDIDKVYKDMFGSVGDLTGGINDAKKANDGFLASFDEVHNIPDFDSGSGSYKPPTLPSGGGGIGGSSPTSPVDSGEVQESTGWLQKLIDKIKEIPPLIPMRFDPPDSGGTAASLALSSVGLSLGILTGNVNLAKTSWLSMVETMKTSLEVNLPVILQNVGAVGLSLVGLSPIMSLTGLNWHAMLDFMQSKLNAYRPYLEYGLSLLGSGLGVLQDAQLLLESVWSKSWQTMYANQLIQSNKMIDSFNAVQAAYAAMQSAIGGVSVSPATHPVGKQSLIMDDLIGSGAGAPVSAPAAGGIGDLLKNFDYAGWFANASKELGLAGLDIGLGASGLKGAQLLGKASPAIKAWLEAMLGGGGKAVTGFAGGGIIGTDSIVRLGEQGRKEAIIPLESNAMQPFANAIASSMGGGGAGGGSGQDIVLTIDGVEFARVTAPYNVRESARIGGSMIVAK